MQRKSRCANWTDASVRRLGQSAFPPRRFGDRISSKSSLGAWCAFGSVAAELTAYERELTAHERDATVYESESAARERMRSRMGRVKESGEEVFLGREV